MQDDNHDVKKLKVSLHVYICFSGVIAILIILLQAFPAYFESLFEKYEFITYSIGFGLACVGVIIILRLLSELVKAMKH